MRLGAAEELAHMPLEQRIALRDFFVACSKLRPVFAQMAQAAKATGDDYDSWDFTSDIERVLGATGAEFDAEAIELVEASLPEEHKTKEPAPDA